MKKVIYTTIFGGYDNLVDPQYKPEGWDFICFTDNDKITSDKWQIKLVTPLYVDGARDNRRYKILPHRHFKEYDISVCVDADVQITNNIDELVDKYLSDHKFSIYSLFAPE